MEKIYKFETNCNIHRIDFDGYPNDEMLIASMDFLGTNPNTHKLNFTEECFEEGCKSALGKFVVADIMYGDASTHTNSESIVGYVPKEQDVVFTQTEDGYKRASVDVVLSKMYARECCDIFSHDNYRSVSVEMKCNTNEGIVECFTIFGITILGKYTNPSSPGSNIQITRFSEDEANNFYHNRQDTISQLKHFAETKRKEMAEGKTYKINKTELKETPWGDIDKTALRNKILGAKNKTALVHAVYALVETGWEDAPSEHLKYPLMQETGGTFYYNRHALSSALGYAEKEGEQSVITKVRKLYKKFGLDDDSKKKEEAKLSQEEKKLSEEQEEMAECENNAEQEEDMACKENMACGEEEMAEDNSENTEDSDEEDSKEEGKEEDMSSDAYVDSAANEAMLEQEAERNREIAEKDNIIMQYEAELAELREFRAQVEEQQKMSIVNTTLAKIKDKVSPESYAQYEATGKTCQFADVTGRIIF
jgi:hypothetical protein